MLLNVLNIILFCLYYKKGYMMQIFEETEEATHALSQICYKKQEKLSFLSIAFPNRRFKGSTYHEFFIFLYQIIVKLWSFMKDSSRPTGAALDHGARRSLPILYTSNEEEVELRPSSRSKSVSCKIVGPC